jgi:ferrous iron transport protein B
LLGVPNCGKTALFNLLTGSHQKVANYPGVTVERREGRLATPRGREVSILDLPGAYSLQPTTPEERVTRDVLLGIEAGVAPLDVVVLVADATNLRLSLRFALEVRDLGRPMILALNLSDLARERGLKIDADGLSRALDMPVVETVAIRREGARALEGAIDRFESRPPAGPPVFPPHELDVETTYREVERLLGISGWERRDGQSLDERIDRIALHPVIGLGGLAIILFMVFQAVFAWAQPLMDGIDAGIGALGALAASAVPDGLVRSLLVVGLSAGRGRVVIFLPQILILFLFILLLEDSGYLPRAAFLLDRLMQGLGLSGRAFIPLLSSFACAIPGIMATRTIHDPRERLVTILIAPLMTCSARLPVYALLIAAFVPARTVGGIFNLQGITLFSLYVAGVASAAVIAWIMRRTFGAQSAYPLLLELPSYRWPSLRNLAFGLMERARIFLTRVGTILLALMIIVWFLSSFPAPPPGAAAPAIDYSFAGRLGHWLEPVFAPIGFNWQICVALIPGLAAREVAVSALGTVYALGDTGTAGALLPILQVEWTLPTALALLAWYVYAPQCISTLAVAHRETASSRTVAFMAIYLFALAWLAAFATYRIALALSGSG